MDALTVLLLLSLLGFQTKGAESIGVCYGRNGNNLPPVREVIALYKSNGIGKMRIYSADKEVLTALRGSNIELIMDVPRNELARLGNNAAAAASWVQTNVRDFFPAVKFKYIAVGNEVMPGDAEASSVLPAMRNVRAALASAGLQDQIKVSTVIRYDVVRVSFPPNQGVFTDAAAQHLRPIMKFLADNRCPLLANIYPYYARKDNPKSVPLPYALFQKSEAYPNLFAAQMDALYAAMEKVGGGGVLVVVSESGWPSGGGFDANPQNAGTYYKNLIQHVKGGTPKKPGPIDTYLFAMFDENVKQGDETEKHYGVFSPNKQPKYQLKFN